MLCSTNPSQKTGRLKNRTSVLSDDGTIDVLNDENDDEKRQIKPAKGRNDPADWDQDGLHQPRDEVTPPAANTRHPRNERIDEHQQQVHVEEVADDAVDLTWDHTYCTPGSCGSVARMLCGTPWRKGIGSIATPSCIT